MCTKIKVPLLWMDLVPCMHTSNVIWLWTIFVGLMVVASRHTQRHRPRSTCLCNNGPHLMLCIAMRASNSKCIGPPTRGSMNIWQSVMSTVASFWGPMRAARCNVPLIHFFIMVLYILFACLYPFFFTFSLLIFSLTCLFL